MVCIIPKVNKGVGEMGFIFGNLYVSLYPGDKIRRTCLV